jgi:hypothetical protein
MRMTLVKLLAALPLELGLHALVLYCRPPYLLGVALLAFSSTALVIWVVEPAAMKMLRSWLHAPTRAAVDALHAAGSLWRVRTMVPDRPGALERLAHGFAEQDLNVLSVHVHALPDRVLDEFVLAAPQHVTGDVVTRTVVTSGGEKVQVWPTTAVALADGQARALHLAARVTADPGELPLALAELLGARTCPDPAPGIADRLAPHPSDGTTLQVVSPGVGPVVLDRPGEPFTPAEAARAHRLAEVASVVHGGRREALG